MEAAPQEEPIQASVPQPQEIGAIRHLVQLELAKAAFPALDARSALKEWITSDPNDPNSLATAFDNYTSDPTHLREHINLHDPAAVAALLEAVRTYQKNSFH